MSEQNGDAGKLNILDQIIKYNILLAMAAYAIGLFETSAYLYSVKTVLFDLNLADLRLFSSGAVILMGLLRAPFCALLLSFWLDHRQVKAARKNHVPRFQQSLRYTFLIVLILFGTLRYHSYANPLAGMLASAACSTIIISAILFPSAYSKLSKLQQLTVIALLVVALLQVARIHGLEMAYRLPDKSYMTHLLVAPDAVEGSKQLGITFLVTQDEHSASLSEEVEVIKIGEKSYLLRTKGNQLVLLGRDKIWGLSDAAPPR